ncbi:hydrogenase 4 subunit F [Ferviditalea candida]|uniref:Hydrogenase 4 subunit F n=1 Tax=Ferviditalea candida TaxID=3108399 RepID=A0ABU5ZHA3_9BACL|nr:hydrogenase 4 subunit F [Paenibacillaceae bacterium T2]
MILVSGEGQVYAWGLFGLIGFPLAAAAASFTVSSVRGTAWTQFGFSLMNAVLATIMLFNIVGREAVSVFDGWIRLDAFAAYTVWLTIVVGGLASLHSIGYIGRELRDGAVTVGRYRQYYAGLHLFVLSMMLIAMMNHIGILWVAVEATTLISALLIAFRNGGAALEAAWKYLIIGGLGIALALFGIILLFAAIPAESVQDQLMWTDFIRRASELNPVLVKVAFLFILVGFGTKAGLAPMHFWLPDAHSQAPSPVSALLSAALLHTALYAVIRIKLIVDLVEPGFSGGLLIVFGLISLAVTVPFFLVQHDLKRLLAYSSVEHMGILALGFGVGGAASFGALLHMFNHAMGKSMLFFSAGSIMQRYHSKRMDRIHGLLRSMPFTGSAFAVGAFAIAGSPPFSLFLSEYTIAAAAFRNGQWMAGVLFLTCVVLIFSGMAYYIAQMLFGSNGHRIESRAEEDGTKAAALAVPLFLLLLFGLYVPPFFRELLNWTIQTLRGVPS